jgi:rSAM/selenodomain-associated transferase 2
VQRLQVVIPTLDEASRIAGLLAVLQPARAAGAQVVVVDGGSRDGTLAAAATAADVVLTSPPGRGLQLAAGIAAGDRPFLWLLHADSRIDGRHAPAVVAALAAGAAWGRFDIRIDGTSPLLRMVGAMMNLRTRSTGIVTGDHGIFCRRDLLAAVGGFPPQPLMEDIEVSSRLRVRAWPRAIGPAIGTSGRRWERHGALRTVLSMWRFRLRYFLGASPEVLAREYYGR